MKNKLFTVVAFGGSILVNLFGGWDMALQTLLLFMAIDWFTGGVLLPGVFGKSRKSASGTWESRAGWKGLCRKCMTLFFVLVAARIDKLSGTDFLRDAVCIGFIANEALSIAENAGLMGVPLPDVLRRSIDILSEKGNRHNREAKNASRKKKIAFIRRAFAFDSVRAFFT